jgi:DNA modification methylase
MMGIHQYEQPRKSQGREWQMIKNTILQGDVIDIIKTLLVESVNCIITSPPYFGLRDYGLPPTNWPEVTYPPMAGLPEITIPAMSCCLGLEDSIESYVGHMVLVFRGLWRVLRDDGTTWLNLGDSYVRGNGKQREIVNGSQIQQRSYEGLKNWRPPTANVLKPKNLIGIPWRIAFALQADGWYLRSDVIWAKKNPMPESVTDRPTKAHEYLFLLAKSERYYYDQDAIREPHGENHWGKNKGGKNTKYQKGSNRGNLNENMDRYTSEMPGHPAGRNMRTVWTVATKPYKAAHFACFPPKLIEPCILASCPSLVCSECGEPWVSCNWSYG